MLNLEEIIVTFWKYVNDNNVELYNEFSLQHELGIFLRNNLNEYKVQFERNISSFSINDVDIKKEIDITIYNADKSEIYAIELKYPRNGQYPEQMYAFIKDIAFMEQLKNHGFTQTCAIVLVETKPFYSGMQVNGIYKYFRDSFPIEGTIYRPTGRKKDVEYIDVLGNYLIIWLDQNAKRKYYIISI